MVDFLDDLHAPETCQLRQRLLEELDAERQELLTTSGQLLAHARLTRFLQGNMGNVEEAAQHFRRMLDWYREADMEGKRRLIEGKEWSVDSVEGGRELFRMMCIEAGKTTPDGTMLWVQRDGLVQIEEIMSLSDEDLVHRMSLICELRELHLDQRSERKGRLEKFLQIRDLTGLNISAVVRNRAVMKRLADVFKIISTAYPETLSKMIIVNPPAGFNMLWMAIQPMLNQRIKQKFVFIPDGPFEFPQKLALLTGCGALEALSDLNREGVKGDWPPGRCSFEHRRLTKGCKASWSFEVQPESCQMQLQVIFFEEVEGCPPVCHEVFPAQAVSGQVSGHCGPLGVKGLLWFTWQNDSWTSTMRLEELKISVDSSGEEELLRNPSSSSVLLQKKKRRGGSVSFTCCLPWFWEADADSEQEPSQVLRHHRLSEPRLARKVLKEPEVVECAEGWEGGLGSPAFHALALRLAALVFIIATAQTARKYLGQLQESFL